MNNEFTLIQDLLLEVLPTWRPRSSHGLTLVPLFGSVPAPDHLLASEAIEQKLLTIKELDQESVPQLIAHNKANLPVLLLDGEHLEGAKQNRIMNASALIAAKHKTVLPVSCVEAGRWHYESQEGFQPSSDLAYSRLRARNTVEVVNSLRSDSPRYVDQGAVWEDVATLHEERGVQYSPSGAMSDAFETSRVELDKILSELAAPEDGQTGVIACVGGTPVALDLFDRPATLEKIWKRLVSGYAMDAVGSEATDLKEETVKAFLADAVAGEATQHAGIGLGVDVVITGTNTIGNALTFDDGIVHLALFPRQQEDKGTDEAGSRIASPRRRRSRHLEAGYCE